MAGYEIIQRPEDWPQRDLLGEGPFWSQAEASLYWVDIVGRRAMRFTPATGAFSRWDLPCFGSAIIPTTRGDAMVALTDGLHRLNLDTGRLADFAQPDQDPHNRSNECRCDPQGRIWLGTMHNNIGPHGEALAVSRYSGSLSCVDVQGRITRLLDGIGIANTLAWSPDQTWLYTADSLKGLIWRFPYQPDGPSLGERKVFAHGLPGSPDGSSIDEEGCLWTAFWGAGRLMRFTPTGKVDRMLSLPVKQPSSCAFGGADLKTLYVTSARQELHNLKPDSLDGAVFALQVDVAGLPMTPFNG